MTIERVIAIRPEPGCSATVARGREMGLPIAGFPLFEILPAEWEVLEPSQFDGLLVGSANVFRHGGEGLAKLRGLPVHAVGAATAKAARASGFTVEQEGQGGLQAVLDLLAGQQRNMLRLAGRDNVPLVPPPGIKLAERICYESRALPMSAQLQDALRQGALVLLHSAIAAEHFARECSRLQVDFGKVTLACLGPRIVDAAGEGWAAIHSAQNPSEAALLALARDMCHGKAIER
ncbi:MAG: uroporphyrinogen-III synthase [Sphingomonadaceae bacterium]|nr:uroporphyrinogen-III synthase [Sphingomonadaceae bacterium]